MMNKKLKMGAVLTTKQNCRCVAILFLPLLFLFSSATLAWNLQKQPHSISSFGPHVSDAMADFTFCRGVSTNNNFINNFEPLISSPSLQNTYTINLEYQYEDQDISTLLQLRIQEEAQAGRLDLENLIVLAPISDTAGELETQLAEENTRYRNSIIERETSPYERTILVPLNLIQLSHWTGIVIRLNSYSDMISINYIDSLGFSTPDTVTESLQRVYGYNINIENTTGLIQTDATSCGPLMIENLIKVAQGIQRSAIVSPRLMERIRARHIKLMESYRSDLNFNKRQRNNARSFSDRNGKKVGALLLPNIKDYNLCLELGLTPLTCGGGGSTDITTNKENNETTKHDIDHEETNWDNLPDGLKSKILDHLKSSDLAKAAPVSKEWYRITKDDVLWFHKVTDEFSPSVIKEAINIYKESISEPSNNSTSTTNKQKQTGEHQSERLERVFKTIYHISGLLANKKTRLMLYKERDELIEMHHKNPDFNIQKLIAAITSQDSKIKALIIRSSSSIGAITNEELQTLADALKNLSCKVIIMELCYYQMGDTDAAALALALKNPNCKVTELNFGINKVGDPGTAAFADALTDPNCKVTELNLRSNEISAAGTEAIALALKNPNCKVTNLRLSSNQIGYAGIAALADALKNTNCKITELNLEHNQIDDAGAAVLARALKNTNCKVIKLNLWDNRISGAGTKDLADALKNPNCKVAELNLGANKVGDAGAKEIAEAVLYTGRKIEVIGIENFSKLLKHAELEERPSNVSATM